MMNARYGTGLSIVDMLLYDPIQFQKMEEAFSALFYGDYLSKLGFPISVVEQL